MEIAPIMDPITNFMGVAFGAAYAFEHTKLCIVIKRSIRLKPIHFYIKLLITSQVKIRDKISSILEALK